jgi:hypothetical protein
VRRIAGLHALVARHAEGISKHEDLVALVDAQRSAIERLQAKVGEWQRQLGQGAADSYRS